MSTNDWVKEIGRWHVWALTIGGVVVLALIVYAGQENWFDDDTLFGFALLGVAAGVFGAAYALTSRQLKADARKTLSDARRKVEDLTEEINELKATLAEAQQNLDKSTADLTKEVTELKARAEAQERKLATQFEAIRDKLDEVNNAITDPGLKTKIEELKALAAPAADRVDEALTSQTAASAIVGQATSLSQTVAALDETTTNAQVKLGEAALFLDAVEDLPEAHRLVGLWVAAGLTIVLLGFLSATGLTITTSGDNPETGTGTSVPTGTETSPE